MWMTYVALALAVITLLLAMSRGSKLKKLEDELRQMKYLEGSLRELRKEMDLKLGLTRKHLAQVSEGHKLPQDMITEGKPFADVGSEQGQKLLEETEGVFVLDVRTDGEYAGGHIPGSTLIPVDQLERRVEELPAKETPMLVVCAGGGRSAAACAMLSERGYSSLHNLAGGMGGWRGPVTRD